MSNITIHLDFKSQKDIEQHRTTIPLSDDTLCFSQCPTSIMASGWWTAKPWLVSRPSASPQLLHQFSVWPGSTLHRACSSLEVEEADVCFFLCAGAGIPCASLRLCYKLDLSFNISHAICLRIQYKQAYWWGQVYLPREISNCIVLIDVFSSWFILVCLSDSQVGVLRVWNASRSTPLDSFKLKKTGFHALHVLNSPLAKKGNTMKHFELCCVTLICVWATKAQWKGLGLL